MIEEDKNQQRKHFFNFRKGFLTSLLSFSVVIPMTLGVVGWSALKTKDDDNSRPYTELINKNFLAYYRAWRDVEMKGVNTDLPDANWMTMNDIPYGINIVNVFSYVPPGQEAKAQPYFDKLEKEYAPALHKRGVKLIRGFGYEKLHSWWTKDHEYQNLDVSHYWEEELPSEEQVKAAAEALIQELMVIGETKLDGIDIDMEQTPNKYQVDISNAVIRELAKKIGPKSGNKGSLFLYDTNGSYLNPFKDVADSFDLLAYQQYGSDSRRTETVIKSYQDYISQDKIMPGLTFPEEKDHNRWYDTKFPYEKSNFYDVAKFVNQNKLGGMFVYALDRDGRNYEKDLERIVPSNLLWTKTAILEANGVSLDTARELAKHHLERIQYSLQLTKTELNELNTKIAEAQNLLDINAVVMGRDYPDAISPTYDPILENNLLFNIDLQPAHLAINKANKWIAEGQGDVEKIKIKKENLEKLMGSKQYSQKELEKSVSELNNSFK